MTLGDPRRRLDRGARRWRVLSALLCTLAAGLLSSHAARAANAWLESSSYWVLELDVPEGAIPPGPADAVPVEPASLSFVHQIHFQMPEHGAAQLRAWLAPEGMGGSGAIIIEVRGRGGARHRIVRDSKDVIEAQGNNQSNDALFVGSADAMAIFSNLLDGLKAVDPDGATRVSELHLTSSAEALKLGCRPLIHAQIVIWAETVATGLDQIRDCAARGARVVVVAPVAKPVVAEGRVATWGLGTYAWVDHMGPTVARAADESCRRHQEGDALASRAWAWPENGAIKEADAHWRMPRGGIFAILAAYVLLLGPGGYWLGMKSRKTWRGWVFFPAAAFVATALLAVVGTATAPRRSTLEVTHIVVTAPDGTGLDRGSVDLSAADSQTYAMTFPFSDGDLEWINRPFRFGSPFSAPAGAIHFAEDRLAQRGEVRGLASGRRGTTNLRWIEPFHRAGGRLQWHGTDLVAINDGSATLTGVTVRVRNATASIAKLPPGEPTAVRFLAPAGAMASGNDPFSGMPLPPDTWVMWGDVESPPQTVQVSPVIAVKTHQRHVVIGPLPEGT